MKPVRLAILDLYDNTPNQGMRCIKAIVQQFSAITDWRVFDVRGKGETPDMSYDIFISSGGPGSPLDGDGHWDRRYFDWLQQTWDWNRRGGRPKKYVFFICHSFQMACRHFRVGKVVPRRSTSFGTYPCHQTDAGAADPLFHGLDNPFYVADFRDWQVIQPDVARLEAIGAELLALEKIRPHVPLERALMAIRFSREFVGTQFHPEADPDGMVEHFLDPDRRKKIVAEHSQRKYLRMMEHLRDPEKISLTHEVVLPGFLRRALQALEAEPVAV